ncbi:MAG: sulfatase family protein [Puniceicoccales bacterium]
MKRPNVLLIYTDQQRGDCLGSNGNSYISTPNLDKLANQGISFSQAFVNCPVCMPSRMSMLSGRYPSALGIRCNGIAMPPEIPCVQHILKAHGYHTANIGKLHFTNHSDRDHKSPHPLYGFDELILSDEPGCYDDAYIDWVRKNAPDQVENCRVDTPPACTVTPIRKHPRDTHQPYRFEGPENLTHTAFVADETIRYLQEHRTGDQPFFCIAGIFAPHCPINPPSRFIDRYKPEDMPLPERLEGENFQDVSDLQWQKVKAYYYALISHVDDQVGRILHELEKTGLDENTLVIFTSDHGENLGDHGRIGKGNPQDSSSHVPLIFSFPKRFKCPRKKSQSIVEAVDIVPTILDTCGVEIPTYFQGTSLFPFLSGSVGQTGRDSALIEFKEPFTRSYKAVRTKDYLYVANGNGSEELYDLAVDPHQLKNIAELPGSAEALGGMRRILIARILDSESHHPTKTAEY